MIIKKKSFLTFIFIGMLLFSKGTFSQKLYLEIISLDKNEEHTLEKINFSNIHSEEKAIYNECLKISNYLKKEGYFTNTIDSIIKKDSIYKSYFSLKNKITVIALKTGLTPQEKDTLFFKPNEIEYYLEEISKNLDNRGQSFSKTTLSKNQIKNDTLYSDLIISSSKERTISKVVIKGYEDFPKKFIRNHLSITENKTTFNTKKLTNISKRLNSLSFVKQIKPPETLFKEDSTLVYIYVDKKQNNSFDGLINFTSREDGSILFNGILDLQFNNILNGGEFFLLNWNAIGDERQELELNLETPYIFNSKITPKFLFNIYRQDSTFINTKFSGTLDYALNSKIDVGLTFSDESSENTTQTTQTNNESFDSFFSGLNFNYRINSNNSLNTDKLNITVNPLLGYRKTVNGKTNQFKLKTIVSYLIELNKRNSIYLKNNTGILNSVNFLNNELFRIGGANSIRGFNEQSFFTSNYTYFNLEYRYATSSRSYFYSITDIGRLQISSNFNNVIGLGGGYSFFTNNSQINFGIALGNNLSNKFQFRNPKVIINWRTFF
jgi:hypothetical protein